MRNLTFVTVLVAAIFWLALPGMASAQTICVHNPTGCVGSVQPDLQQALAVASSNGQGVRDTIRIGAGIFYEGPVGDLAGNPVDIVGESSTATILRAQGTSKTVLTIAEPSSTVSNLRVEIIASGNEIGINLAGSLDHVAVVSSGTQASSDGIVLSGMSAAVDKSLVDLGYTPNELSHGVVAQTGSSGKITDSRLVAMTAAGALGGSLDIQRTSIWGARGADAVGDGYILIRDSLVRSPGPYSSNYQPYALGASGTGTSLLEAYRVTAYGDNSQYSTGVYLNPNNVQGANAVVSLNSSVLWNFARAAWLIQTAGTSTLNTGFSAYDPSHIHLDPGASHNHFFDMDLTGDPGFVDAAGGVFSLRHDSQLVDAGQPGAANVPYDLAGNDRLRDGDGDANARADIGAYEYQRAIPVPSASATPDTAAPAQPISFEGAATDADPDDSLTYAWSFDDGATATGKNATHSFATSGQHTGTLTVTDLTGQSATATATVSIVAPESPASSEPSEPAGSVPSADGPIAPVPAATATTLVAPVITKLRLSRSVFRTSKRRGRPSRSRTGTTARFYLSRNATVTVTIEQRIHGRWTLAGVLRKKLTGGNARIQFDGHLRRGRRLAPGSYRMRLQAQVAGLVSRTVNARFRVVT